MSKIINSSEVRERLQAYFKGGIIDMPQLMIDLVFLTKWVGKDKHDIMSEFAYQWDRVHLSGEIAHKPTKPGVPH